MQHDVFLITRNAMHFNSSGTVYFRQARAIHELAIRVFHVLGTDPENFEVEFLGTRRRSTRRAQNEANSDRLTKHVKANSVATNFYSKGTSSSHDTSLVRKADRRKPLVASSMAFHTNRNSCGFFSGATVGRRSNYVETDRRSTYIPQSGKNTFGSNCFCTKPLVLISRQDTNYRESLLLFVKDLGPIAHMFAAQKIHGLHESSSTCQTVGSTGWGIQATCQCQTPAACGSGLTEPHHWRNFVCTNAPHRFSGLLHGCCSSVFKTMTDIIFDHGSGKGGEKDVDKKRKSCNEGASISDNGAETVGNTGEANVVSACGEGEVIRDGKNSTEFWLGSCSSDASVGDVGARDLKNSWTVSNKSKIGKPNIVTTSADTTGGKGGKSDESVLRPVVLALEHSHGNVTSELKSRNRNSCTAAADDWGSQSQSRACSNHMNSTWGRCHKGTGGSVAAMKVLQPLDSSKKKKKDTITMERPLAALSDQPFTFNMHFLKAQLNQMKIPAVAERNKQGRQMHDDDDDELQLIRSPNWDRDNAETCHKMASTSYFHVQGQQKARLCNATTTANTGSLVLKSTTSSSRPLSLSSSLEPKITTSTNNSYASKPIHTVTLPTNNNHNDTTTSSSNTNTESSFSSWPWESGCYGHRVGSQVEQSWS